MRLEQIMMLRERFRNVMEPLPTERTSKDVIEHFRVMPRESLKRLLVDATAPWALRLLQPLIRRRAKLAIPVQYDLLSWEDRWAMGAMFSQLFRVAPPRKLSAVLV